MDNKSKLRRFCFLGSFEPVYVHLRLPVNVRVCYPIIDGLIKEINETDFVAFMREMLKEAKLVRKDETLLVYAAYLASTIDIKVKTLVRKAFPALILNDDDLFLFCKMATMIAGQQNRKIFSKTVRKAITDWYANRSPEEIAAMWLERRGSHGFSHKVLIKLCHITDKTIGSGDAVKPFFKTCTQIMKDNGLLPVAPTSTTTTSSATITTTTTSAGTTTTDATATSIATTTSSATTTTTDDVVSHTETTQIRQNIEQESSTEQAATTASDAVVNMDSNDSATTPMVVDNNDAAVSLTEATQIHQNTEQQSSTEQAATTATTTPTTPMVVDNQQVDETPIGPGTRTKSTKPTPGNVVAAIAKLRTYCSKHEAIKIIRKYKLTYTQVPGYLLRHPVIMEAVLPSMPYLHILKHWRKMARFNHFKTKKNFKICQKLLENKDFSKKSNIHPIHLLMHLRQIGLNDVNNVPPKRLEALKLEYLENLYQESFNWQTETGNLRMFITLNLQTNYKKKMLKNHKKLNYYDACRALSFGFFKRESKVDIFYWSDDTAKLSPITIQNDYSAELAFASYDAAQNDKNKQRLIVPIMNALASKEIYDVFLCIVPTAGRGNPKQNSDFLCKWLDKYHETKNPKARFIILDLLKYKRSMKYSDIRKEDILEICGLDEHTINLIYQFANHRFD